MPYQIPQGLENSLWEQYRAARDLQVIHEEDKEAIRADFELWRNQKQLGQRYEDITDFGSEYYQQYRGLMGKITPTVGKDVVLSGLRAGGGNYAASQVQANARIDELSKERTDFLNTNVTQFALGSQAQAGGLLGQMSGNAQFMAQLAEQRRQFDESQPDFLDSLLNIGGMAAGIVLAPTTGGASLAIPLAQQGMKPGKGSQPSQPNYGGNYGNTNYGYGYDPYGRK